MSSVISEKTVLSMREDGLPTFSSQCFLKKLISLYIAFYKPAFHSHFVDWFLRPFDSSFYSIISSVHAPTFQLQSFRLLLGVLIIKINKFFQSKIEFEQITLTFLKKTPKKKLFFTVKFSWKIFLIILSFTLNYSKHLEITTDNFFRHVEITELLFDILVTQCTKTETNNS